MYFRIKHKTHVDKGKIFAWMALMIGLGNASFWTIFPLVTDAVFQSEAKVGLFFALVSVFTLCGSLYSTVILRAFSRVNLAKAALLLVPIALFLLSFIHFPSLLVLIELFRSFFSLLVGIILALYVRDTAKKHRLGMAEGRYYLFANIGWFVGPILGGFIGTISRTYVFWFSAAMYLLAFVIFQQSHHVDHPLIQHKKEHLTLLAFWKNVKDFWRKKELRKVYAMALGMNVWWSVATIYIPLYVILHGFGDHIVGLIIGLGMFILVLLERFVGMLADKQGVRRYFVLGFFLLAIFTFSFELLPLYAIFAMVLVNIGVAFIEPLQEMYLFSVIKKKDEERFFGVYNTAEPIANILGPAFAALLIFLGGLSLLWYGFGVVFLVFTILATRTKYKSN